MNDFVLDASVALAWYVDNPMPSLAVRAMRAIEDGYQAIAPALWAVEMANGLCMAERHGKLTAQQVDRGLQQLEILTGSAIEVQLEGPTVRQALVAAQSYQLTAYDAVYLELARCEGVPLATLDKELRSAAVKVGVALLA